MNQDLMELVKDYATKDHATINSALLGKSKDNLISMLMDLLTNYYNDLNSSSLREALVVLLSGYSHQTTKIGFNGYKQDSITGKTRYCEAKPVNIRSDAQTKTKRKLNGGGNFTDFTWAKLRGHTSENPEMLVAGFVDAKLIYIFRFDYAEPVFISRLREQLIRMFPDGDIKGQYLRSATFSLKHYQSAESLRHSCYVSEEELKDLFEHKYLTKQVFQHLSSSGGGVVVFIDRLLVGDALAVLETIPDSIIHLGVTSPPYNKQEKNKGWLVKNVVYDSYKDAVPEKEYQEGQVQVLNQIHRVTKPGGSFFYNHKLRWVRGELLHPMDWLRNTEWTVKQEIIWDRVIAANIRGWRFWQVEERIYWLYKPIGGKLIGKELASRDAKLTSIWRGVPEGKNPHPAPFPVWLPARAIISILDAEEPGLVLDPYIGSGTTAVAAKLLGHHYLGIDRSKEYLKYAEERIACALSEMPKIQDELSLHRVGDSFSKRKQTGMNVGKHRNSK